MAGKRTPGPTCGTSESLDDGTLCREATPLPGPVSASDWVVTELARAGPRAYGTPKAVALDLLDLLPVKLGSPISLALFRHYVKGSGEPYILEDIPETWKA